MEGIVRDVEELRQMIQLQQHALPTKPAGTATGAMQSAPPDAVLTLPTHLPSFSPCLPTGLSGTFTDEAGADGRAPPECISQATAAAPWDTDEVTETADGSSSAMAALKVKLVEATTALTAAQLQQAASTAGLTQQTEALQAALTARDVAVSRAAAATARCEAAEAALQQQAQQQARLQRGLRTCQEDMSVMDAQWEALVASVVTVRTEAAALAVENGKLSASLAASEAQCETLRGVHEACAAALATVEGLEAERTAREAEWATLTQHFTAAKAAVADGMAYWAAVRSEHGALEEALAAARAANVVAWTAAAAGTRELQSSPLKSSSQQQITPIGGEDGSQRSESVESTTEEGARDGERCSDCATREAHMNRMEEKVVDLAIALQHAQAELRALRQAADDRMASPVAVIAVATTLSVVVQTLQSALRPLTEAQAQQAAALQASEAVVRPLLDQNEQLLAMFTEEAHHTHALEVALAVASAGPKPPAEGYVVTSTHATAAAAAATHLERRSNGGGDGGPPLARSSSGARRQTFSYTKLREREAQQHYRWP